jgi:hypothetical protein
MHSQLHYELYRTLADDRFREAADRVRDARRGQPPRKRWRPPPLRLRFA